MKIIYLKKSGWVKIEEKGDETIITPLSQLTDKAFSIKSQHKHRTIAQNSSIHLYCQKVANSLNDAGFSVNTVLNRKRNYAISKAFKSAKRWLMGNNRAIKALERLEAIVLGKGSIELNWTTLLVKDIIWRKIQIALYKNKYSTTKLHPEEVTEVYRAMDKYLTIRIGIESIDFPSIDSLMANS